MEKTFSSSFLQGCLFRGFWDLFVLRSLHIYIYIYICIYIYIYIYIYKKKIVGKIVSVFSFGLYLPMCVQFFWMRIDCHEQLWTNDESRNTGLVAEIWGSFPEMQGSLRKFRAVSQKYRARRRNLGLFPGNTGLFTEIWGTLVLSDNRDEWCLIQEPRSIRSLLRIYTARLQKYISRLFWRYMALLWKCKILLCAVIIITNGHSFMSQETRLCHANTGLFAEI